MRRDNIPLDDLLLPSFSVWGNQWFLLTAGENAPEKFNSMTVSWGAFGRIWEHPLAIVVVRPQRWTLRFMEKYNTFSLCAFPQQYHETLNMLGSRSGRNTSKMADCGLTPIPLTQIACPGFAEAELILECKKTYFDDLRPEHFLADYIAPHYTGDYHRMYLGEVVAASGVAQYRKG